MWIIRLRSFFLVAGLVIVLCAVGIIGVFGLRPGIDFTGGTLIEVSYQVIPDRTEIESLLSAQSIAESQIRESTTDTGKGYLITTTTLTPEVQAIITSNLTTLGEGGVVTRLTSIGPVIGQELRDKAVWAIGAVLLIIICYVAFAFAGIGRPVSSWVYGAMTILVLVHDILVPIALMSVLGAVWGIEVDVLFVTALLTILGYSVNDTIVIFDRVREQLIRNRTETRTKISEVGGIEREEVVYTLTKPFSEIVGQAVEDTMARSINTSLTVLIALIALFIFGSEVTRTFVLVLMAGVFAGAYSSIFIASPLLVKYAEWRKLI
jgi:preprotein translocase subunit SecF